MPKIIRRIAWLIGIVVVVGLLFAYLTRSKPIPVALADVETAEVRSVVANTRAGTVKACNRARLSPPIGGQIAALHVHEGDQVEAGQDLLELWNEDLAADLLLAQRDANAAGARAEEACVTSSVAQREANRIKRLRQKGLSSAETADAADGQAQATKAACKAARAQTAVSQARIDHANAALDRTVLRAPFSGTVAEINGEVGEFVTPSPLGIVTPPAIDLIDNSCLYIAAPIDEVDAPAIRAGMPARITLDAFPSHDFAGTVRRVAPYVLDLEKQARTVEIEAVIDTPQNNLLPGYSADIEVLIETRDSVVRIPTQAILSGNKVLVYDAAESLLEEREIETGLSNWEYTEIVSGLQDGDRVVISVDRAGVEAGAHVAPE
ncbi:MAG: efflux RND transporter periplasmic adaptor subunit [Gammaproteobacteria bacterium]|nr:efflux RND transporter periplasmic adaptor subunit [Gammaproteobacteria bacterium]MDH3769315.1 efflux RND transporter periplasmic adaptor subunit [Gammaproteobacteria bacterium]